MNHDENCWKLLLENAELLREIGDREMLSGASHITYAQGKVLRLLFRRPEGMMQKEIAAELGITKGAVSQTLEWLAGAGFVAFSVPENDHRAHLVRLSPKGEATRRRHVENYSRLTAEALAGCPEGEIAAYLETLRKMKSALRKHRRAE